MLHALPTFKMSIRRLSNFSRWASVQFPGFLSQTYLLFLRISSLPDFFIFPVLLLPHQIDSLSELPHYVELIVDNLCIRQKLGGGYAVIFPHVHGDGFDPKALILR